MDARLPRLALPIAMLFLACLAVAFCQRPSAVDRSGRYAAHISAGAEAEAANAAWNKEHGEGE